MDMVLYHFTTHEGYNNIERDGFILPSVAGKYGAGVYLTDLDPDKHSVEEISKALYGKGGTKNLRAGKLDHHFCLKLNENHIKYERPNVYRYVGDLHLSPCRVISQGMIKEFGSGLLIAATAVEVGTALYSHATDGRKKRTQDLNTALQTLLRSTHASTKFIPVVSKDGGSVQVCCTECNFSPVSDVYEGGYLFSSTIDEKQLQERLWKHEMSHNMTNAALSVFFVFLYFIGCIFAAPVFFAGLWLQK
eukprot:CAMPEP_0201691222 /NCGR_PEP_ID=MMETSP0578-20130828/4441_1 /ASSEMBLY_ACC=CAM_ASM_000663 /TAXON_ID=267565 /ORGANISM="Skeletonema grethea, Strain CCMP 1804" /LENGTH=247 /DNA_ID=CAMNT_0048176383 /DNA_START=82 /DNA_END=825 /DNA_ORIENTATION=-